jgi:hypothetical protein
VRTLAACIVFNAFRSAEPRMFPLTDEEKQQLLSMYPAGWKPQGP